jgi:hypothetical protein
MKNKIITTFLILITTGFCQTNTLGQKVKNLAEKRSEIEITLSLKESNKNACNLTQLSLMVKLTNIGKRIIAFDARRVTRKLYIRSVITVINADGKGGSGFQTDSEIIFPHFQMTPSYIILKPKEFYEGQIFLDLADPDFKSANFLQIQTDYSNSNKATYLNIPVFIGYKRSNEITLDLSNCK